MKLLSIRNIRIHSVGPSPSDLLKVQAMPRFLGLSCLLLLAACSEAEDVPETANEAQSMVTPDGYREAASALEAAISSGDAQSLRTLLGEDLLWIRGSGAEGDKAAFIAALASDELSIEPFKPAEPKWYIEGNSALLTGINTLTGTADGDPFVDRHRFADHWIWRDGKWELVYIQVTPLPTDDTEN